MVPQKDPNKDPSKKQNPNKNQNTDKDKSAKPPMPVPQPHGINHKSFEIQDVGAPPRTQLSWIQRVQEGNQVYFHSWYRTGQNSVTKWWMPPPPTYEELMDFAEGRIDERERKRRTNNWIMSRGNRNRLREELGLPEDTSPNPWPKPKLRATLAIDGIKSLSSSYWQTPELPIHRPLTQDNPKEIQTLIDATQHRDWLYPTINSIGAPNQAASMRTMVYPRGISDALHPLTTSSGPGEEIRREQPAIHRSSSDQQSRSPGARLPIAGLLGRNDFDDETMAAIEAYRRQQPSFPAVRPSPYTPEGREIAERIAAEVEYHKAHLARASGVPLGTGMRGSSPHQHTGETTEEDLSDGPSTPHVSHRRRPVQRHTGLSNVETHREQPSAHHSSSGPQGRRQRARQPTPDLQFSDDDDDSPPAPVASSCKSKQPKPNTQHRDNDEDDVPRAPATTMRTQTFDLLARSPPRDRRPTGFENFPIANETLMSALSKPQYAATQSQTMQSTATAEPDMSPSSWRKRSPDFSTSSSSPGPVAQVQGRGEVAQRVDISPLGIRSQSPSVVSDDSTDEELKDKRGKPKPKAKPKAKPKPKPKESKSEAKKKGGQARKRRKSDDHKDDTKKSGK